MNFETVIAAVAAVRAIATAVAATQSLRRILDLGRAPIFGLRHKKANCSFLSSLITSFSSIVSCSIIQITELWTELFDKRN